MSLTTLTHKFVGNFSDSTLCACVSRIEIMYLYMKRGVIHRKHEKCSFFFPLPLLDFSYDWLLEEIEMKMAQYADTDTHKHAHTIKSTRSWTVFFFQLLPKYNCSQLKFCIVQTVAELNNITICSHPLSCTATQIKTIHYIFVVVVVQLLYVFVLCQFWFCWCLFIAWKCWLNSNDSITCSGGCETFSPFVLFSIASAHKHRQNEYEWKQKQEWPHITYIGLIFFFLQSQLNEEENEMNGSMYEMVYETL